MLISQEAGDRPKDPVIDCLVNATQEYREPAFFAFHVCTFKEWWTTANKRLRYKVVRSSTVPELKDDF